MDFFIENLYTVVLAPFWVFLIIILGKFFAVPISRKVVTAITLLATGYGLIFSIALFAKTNINSAFVFESSYNFLKLNSFSFDFGIYLDNLSSLLLIIICSISFLVQLYSYSYMNYDKSFMRFFAYLNLFNFSMIGLVLSPNLFQTYIFWELVGVTSYLLIGFWYKKPSASTAAKKAFIMNRIGDFGLLSGIMFIAFLLYNYAGNVSLITIPYSSLADISSFLYSYTTDIAFVLICILLLMGSIAKSAQFPLHTWLADAMEGPTPVSALIHSATMVAAGVYLIARLYPLYSMSSAVLAFISIVGLITALICAFFALTQVDLKKILAYSTNSQLGLMFLAIGAGSVTSSMLYLTMHAYIKAMLFLCAGIVLHSLSEKLDIRYMGGLRRFLPTCAICCFIGCLSLSGILFSGFYAKELVLTTLITNKHYIYALFFLMITFMSAFYLFRMYFMVFEGRFKGEKEPKTSNLILNVPVVACAVITIALGFVIPHSNNVIIAWVSVLIALSGLILAYIMYGTNFNLKKIPILYNLSFNRFYVDNLYDYFVKIYEKIAKIASFIDKYLFDGLVILSTVKVRVGSWVFSKLQTGNVQSYLTYSVVGLMFIFTTLILAYSIIIYLTGA